MAVIIQITEENVQDVVDVNNTDTRIVETLAGHQGPSGLTLVHHGTDNTVPRPEGAIVVYWLGTATPDNSEPFDLWLKENV